MSRRNQTCKNCSAVGTIVEDNGSYICSNCGSIMSETILINDVAFTQMANGRTARNGQFVHAPNHKQSYATSTQSSIQGKAHIQAICRELPRLDNQPEVIARAERIFKESLHKRFIRGRTIEIVAAACVYVAIRQTMNTGYLLVDVADHISCGIFELAATALRLSQKIGEELPVIDPTLYIDRFTDELSFGALAPQIKETAIRVIRRLDRDWIQTGRKPAGVCGAAIMLAARIHGVHLSKETIMKCARVCASTINKRLNEISRTQLARASIAELRENSDIIDQECREEPPAWSLRRKLEEIQELIEEKDEGDLGLQDTFSDNDLADVDSLVLTEEETEKRSALFCTLYKTKLEQPPKEPKPKKQSKKAKKGRNHPLDPDPGGMEFMETDERVRDDDELVSDGGFEDIESS